MTALVATGCGGGDVTAAKDGDSPDAQKTRNGIVLRATWPLTGLDAHDAAPTHPPLVRPLGDPFLLAAADRAPQGRHGHRGSRSRAA